jgi:hypothetical protein
MPGDLMTFQELKAIALANPKGKIVSRRDKATKGQNDYASVGNWQGTDCCRDFYGDVLEAALRLSGNPERLVGNEKTLKPLFQQDALYETHTQWMLLLPIFWWAADKFIGPKDFIVADETAEDGLVILVGSNGSAVLIDTR